MEELRGDAKKRKDEEINGTHFEDKRESSCFCKDLISRWNVSPEELLIRETFPVPPLPVRLSDELPRDGLRGGLFSRCFSGRSESGPTDWTLLMALGVKTRGRFPSATALKLFANADSDGSS